MCPFSAGEESDEVDALVSTLELARGRRSIGGCCSTGKKLHSFLRRIQLSQRPCGSSGANRHLIFLRLQ